MFRFARFSKLALGLAAAALVLIPVIHFFRSEDRATPIPEPDKAKPQSGQTPLSQPAQKIQMTPPVPVAKPRKKAPVLAKHRKAESPATVAQEQIAPTTAAADILYDMGVAAQTVPLVGVMAHWGKSCNMQSRMHCLTLTLGFCNQY